MSEELFSPLFQKSYAFAEDETVAHTYVGGKQKAVECPIDGTSLVTRPSAMFYHCKGCGVSYSSLDAERMKQEAALYVRQVKVLAKDVRERLEHLEEIIRAGHRQKIISIDDVSSSQPTQ